ncbi:hypothetical protein N7475_007323 [Penicillium sp. IBT 31633x]|nr:hypothetical protein N7475_007323 [Penicillium sp. IBT 31633x]
MNCEGSDSNGIGQGQGQQTSRNLGQRLQGLEQISSQLQEWYLRLCDVSIPVQWATATVIRLALARAWLIAHLPEGMFAEYILLMGNSHPESPMREQLFSTTIEVLEFAYLLETDFRTKRWSWLFENYPQWHSVVFLLSELCARPQTILADRAWAVVVKAVARWTNTDPRKDGITPKVIHHLIERAAAASGRVWEGTGS